MLVSGVLGTTGGTGDNVLDVVTVDSTFCGVSDEAVVVVVVAVVVVGFT